jgi:hypothetical protein
MDPRSCPNTHSAGHITYSSVCSWGTWTRPAPMAAAPAAQIELAQRLHKHKPHTQQQQRKHMPSSRVPVQAHTTAPNTLSRPHNVLQCLQLGHVDQACTNGRRARGTDTVVFKAAHTQATHTHSNNATANTCHRSAFPCKHTPPPSTHSRAHNVLQSLQPGHVDQACTDGRCTLATNVIALETAGRQAAQATTPSSEP